MIKKWKKAVDNEKVFGALLTDLSKAFDSINPTQKYNRGTARNSSSSCSTRFHSWTFF